MLAPSVRCMMFTYFLMSVTLIINGVMPFERTKVPSSSGTVSHY